MNYLIAALVIYLVFAVGLWQGRKWERDLQEPRDGDGRKRGGA